MSTINLNDVAEILSKNGIKSEFVNSGGGCGTIYLGEYDSQGYAEFAVGPSDYFSGETSWEDLNWGVDGSDFATYASEIIGKDEFTPSVVASCISLAFYYAKGKMN